MGRRRGRGERRASSQASVSASVLAWVVASIQIAVLASVVWVVLGPMLVSLVLNALGWVETVRLNEFVLLAQITIGGQIGSRLSRVPFREVVSYLIDGLLVSIVTLSIYTGFALAVAGLLGMRLLDAYIGFFSFKLLLRRRNTRSAHSAGSGGSGAVN
mgnify:CR=1 FL=1